MSERPGQQLSNSLHSNEDSMATKEVCGSSNGSNGPGGRDSERDLEIGEGGDVAAHESEKPTEEKDSNLIEWNGPDDPENPMNWPRSKKWIITVVLGFMTFCVTFASSVFSTATIPVALLFGVSTETTTLGTSLFVLGFAFGPLVCGDTYHYFHRDC